jgi:hypothetical protein
LDELRNHLFLDDVQPCHSCRGHSLMVLPATVGNRIDRSMRP